MVKDVQRSKFTRSGEMKNYVMRLDQGRTDVESVRMKIIRCATTNVVIADIPTCDIAKLARGRRKMSVGRGGEDRIISPTQFRCFRVYIKSGDCIG